MFGIYGASGKRHFLHRVYRRCVGNFIAGCQCRSVQLNLVGASSSPTGVHFVRISVVIWAVFTVTIFTTAYSEHAVEAFDLNAVDYLLKPFSFERFLQSINKAKEFLIKKQTPSVFEAEKEFLTMKVDGKIEKIIIKDIVYVEGLKEYIKIITPTRQYVTLESMKNMEETLASHDFIRAHKSYIVSKKRVQSLEGNMLDLGAKIKIPISRERKEEVVKAIFDL